MENSVSKLITVQNNTKQGVIRANMLFPSKSVVQVPLDINTSKFKEIKACSALKILSIEDYEPQDYAVYKVDTEKSAVVVPEVSVKEEEPEPVEEIVVAPGKEPEPVEEIVIAEPEIDVVPVTVDADEALPDVTELEVEEGKETTVIAISCPYCDFISTAKTGLFHHVRIKHPDNYEEYKLRFKNT
jgi:hypothetical protein